MVVLLDKKEIMFNSYRNLTLIQLLGNLQNGIMKEKQGKKDGYYKKSSGIGKAQKGL